jgi:D-alanyl-D-alanine carboxypeptidase
MLSLIRAAGLTFAMVLLATALPSGRAEARDAALLMDGDTGEILMATNADELNFPASLTKMMTLYMAFEALDQRRLTLSQPLSVSAYASSMSPSKLGLRPDGAIRTEDAILGLVTRSANDAAVVLAEAMGGTEANFARAMTQRARRLGMSRTTFMNASGLPDAEQTTTARDMAILGRALIRDHQKYYPYFSTRSFNYRGAIIPNHNRMLSNYEGVDGIKTGFIRASGFNLVASAKRDGRRLIGVVMGGQSPGGRDAQMARMFDAGFGVSRSEAVASAALRAKPQQAAAQQAAGQVAKPPVAAGRAAPDEPRPTQVSTKTAGPLQAGVQANAPVASSGDNSRWMVQIGAFQQLPQAQQAARAAASNLRLPGAAPVVTENRSGNGTIYRARLSGLTEPQAREACRTLNQSRAGGCLAIPPGAG